MKKMIHQTWKTATPEDSFPAKWMNSWRSLNPDWGYRLWTDEDIHDYVRVNHADFFPV